MLITKENNLKDQRNINSVELENQRIKKYSQEPAVVNFQTKMDFENRFANKMIEQRGKLQMKQEDLAKLIIEERLQLNIEKINPQDRERLIIITRNVIDNFENARYVKNPQKGDIYQPMNLEFMEKI